MDDDSGCVAVSNTHTHTDCNRWAGEHKCETKVRHSKKKNKSTKGALWNICLRQHQDAAER